MTVLSYCILKLLLSVDIYFSLHCVLFTNVKMEFAQDARAMSDLITLGKERAHVCPSYLTSKNRSVGQEIGGMNTKSGCFYFLKQFLSTVAGICYNGLNKVITICLSQGTLQCCHVGHPCTANRHGGGMETQMTRTPSNRRASHPAENMTASFQVGPSLITYVTPPPPVDRIHITIVCAKLCLIYSSQASII